MNVFEIVQPMDFGFGAMLIGVGIVIVMLTIWLEVKGDD